eukprot:TRINITY_DN11455_c0_g1_i1.p3 TRINITY_DN11455_c0_g1~~TRINITY_DN11455_c0_g1_i1.p3  ORF type:complete len:67 (-),score=10.84 TRINITY_DN11455_c0_g1_i1:264-464(-)
MCFLSPGITFEKHGKMWGKSTPNKRTFGKDPARNKILIFDALPNRNSNFLLCFEVHSLGEGFPVAA